MDKADRLHNIIGPCQGPRMTDAPEPTTEVVKTITDPDTPTITLDMARLGFGLVDPELLYGVEREDYDRVKLGLAEAGPEHAKQAWDAAIRLLDYLPLDQLSDALARLPRVEDQIHRDADYLLTWGLWDHRASSSYREGIDYFPGEVEEDWTPAINGQDELDAFNTMATSLDLAPSPMANPDSWRRHRLYSRVWGRVFSMGPDDRASLKAQVDDSAAPTAAKQTATAWIDGLPLPSRYR